MVGWSIADHIRSELVVDALQMAIWRRRPPQITRLHIGTTDLTTRHGRSAGGCGYGLLGSMGSIGDCFDNSVAESFFGTLQLSCSTSTAGRAVSTWPRRSSIGSRAGTTRAEPQLLRDV